MSVDHLRGAVQVYPEESLPGLSFELTLYLRMRAHRVVGDVYIDVWMVRVAVAVRAKFLSMRKRSMLAHGLLASDMLAAIGPCLDWCAQAGHRTAVLERCAQLLTWLEMTGDFDGGHDTEFKDIQALQRVILGYLKGGGT